MSIGSLLFLGKNAPKIPIEIDQAENILNEDHYGLDKPKSNVLEYLAVLKLVEQLKGPILCFSRSPQALVRHH